MLQVLWDDGEGANVQHIAEHGLVPADVEAVLDDLNNPTDVSHSSGLPITFGYISDGRYIAVVWEEVEEGSVYPITAYEVSEPKE